VTVTGLGGVGKTRLARKVAALVQRAFPDGVWLVELDDLEDSGLLAASVTMAVGAQADDGRSFEDTLRAHVEERSMLIVLDGCERHADAAADLIDHLLASAADVRVLATSRQRLGVAGEAVLSLLPLALPDGAALSRTAPAELLTCYPAVQLFTERAASARPGFTLTAENAEDVAGICTRLDGLPLALELAAARLRVMSPEELLARLDERYRLVSSTMRAVPPRQRKLWAVLGSSWDLCTPAEQRLWSRLSVFTGSFELEAVEFVCSHEGIDSSSIPDLLAGLVDKSVVVQEERSGRVRFRLLSVVRQFGWDTLVESGGRPRLEHRLRQWCLSLAERTLDEWKTPRQREWLARLQTEHANLRGALESALQPAGDPAAAVRLAAALRLYWVMTRLTGEGRAWMERGQRSDLISPATRIRGLWVAAYLALQEGDADDAADKLASCRELIGRTGSTTEQPWSDLVFGLVCVVRRDVAEARRSLERARAEFDARGEANGLSEALFLLAFANALDDDHAGSDRWSTEAVTMPSHRWDDWGRAYTLMMLGYTAFRRGKLHQAAETLEVAVGIMQSFPNVSGTERCLQIRAWVAAATGDHRRAATLLGAAPASGWLAASVFADRHEDCERAVRRALGDRVTDELIARGQNLELAQAVALACGDGKPVAARIPATVADSGLTERELQVAELVADGLNNREIAAALVISRRTAEGHVQHILTKLGFASRSQIASWMTHQRLGRATG
jgi:non-specific serine/threonine protein kinase